MCGGGMDPEFAFFVYILLPVVVCIAASIAYFPPQYSGLMSAVLMAMYFRATRGNPLAITFMDIESIFVGLTVTLIMNFMVNPQDYYSRGWTGVLELTALVCVGVFAVTMIVSSIPTSLV